MKVAKPPRLKIFFGPGHEFLDLFAYEFLELRQKDK